ncbi:MAG: DnaJ domain-containing protein [Marmoricola sp.]
MSYYDLLGVAPDASPGQIKAAWRAATDKFEPGSGTGQFRLFNEAADVLLDSAKRAAYDAEQGHPPASPATPVSPTKKATSSAAPAAATSSLPSTHVESDLRWFPKKSNVDSATATDTSENTPTTRLGRPVPPWLMAVLAVLSVVALVLGGVFWIQHRHQVQRQDAGQEASATAERALPVILSYDYRHLSADRDQAARFLNGKYKREYTTTFNKLVMGTTANPGPALQTKAVVKGTVVNIGVVDAEPGVAKVIVFLDQATVKGGGTPKFSLNRLTVSMVKAGNTWLVDKIDSY